MARSQSLMKSSSYLNPHPQVFRKSVVIDAPRAKVWHALTQPDQMQGWMAQSEIDIRTDWNVGSPIVIRGELHGWPFENRGTVLAFQPESVVRYSHLSSTSRLPDEPASYAQIGFELTELSDHHTELAIEVSHSPTEVIYKHLAYYWTVTLEVLKRRLEGTEPA